MEESLRAAAKDQGWEVARVFADDAATDHRQWGAMLKFLAKSEADVVMVSTLAVISGEVRDVLDEIVTLRGAKCDLFVQDVGLDTTSPVDRVLFRFAEALRAIPARGSNVPGTDRRRRAQAKPFEPTPYQRSVIRGALGSGLKPREVAKALKVSIALVKQVEEDG